MVKTIQNVTYAGRLRAALARFSPDTRVLRPLSAVAKVFSVPLRGPPASPFLPSHLASLPQPRRGASRSQAGCRLPVEKPPTHELRCLSKSRLPHQQRHRRIRCQNLDSAAYETSWHALVPYLAHRPCLLSAPVSSATAGTKSPNALPHPRTWDAPETQGNCIKLEKNFVRLPESGRGAPCGCPPPLVGALRGLFWRPN